jgi:anti-sigma regulatory factor (Ser/Thr protein kinase)/anti-anti-sigma regulatory factor
MHSQPSRLIALLPEVVVDVSDHLDAVVLQLRGRLSRRGKVRIREYIAKSLANTGRALIDLSGLHCSQTELLMVFPTALAAAGGWPSARLVLFGASAAVRSALVSVRIPDTVPLAAGVASAYALLDQRPLRVRRHRDLPAHPRAAAGARMLVREASAAWSLPPEVGETAELVASELVSNAVDHAHTPSRLTLTYIGALLYIAVRDYCPCPAPVRPRLQELGAFRGRGLHLVAVLAKAWSVDWHPDGKTVWASLAIDAPR